LLPLSAEPPQAAAETEITKARTANLNEFFMIMLINVFGSFVY
jgi:hypothetical protein